MAQHQAAPGWKGWTMTTTMNERPDLDAVGWCHSCETMQRGRDARLNDLWWNRGTLAWCCVHCPGEPWGLGVWADGQFDQWAACADVLCSSYPGNCTEHGSNPTPGEPAGQT